MNIKSHQFSKSTSPIAQFYSLPPVPSIFKQNQVAVEALEKAKDLIQNIDPTKRSFQSSSILSPRRQLRTLDTIQFKEISFKLLNINKDNQITEQNETTNQKQSKMQTVRGKKKKQAESINFPNEIASPGNKIISPSIEIASPSEKSLFSKEDSSLKISLGSPKHCKKKSLNLSKNLEFVNNSSSSTLICQRKDLKLSQQQEYFQQLKSKSKSEFVHKWIGLKASKQIEKYNSSANQYELKEEKEQLLNNDLPEKKKPQKLKPISKLAQIQSQFQSQSNIHSLTYRSNYSEYSPRNNKETNLSFYFKKVKINQDIQVSEDIQKQFLQMKIIIHKCILNENDSSKSLEILAFIEQLLSISTEMRNPYLHLCLLELNGIAFYALGNYQKSINVFKFLRSLCIYKDMNEEKMRAYKFLFLVYSLLKNHQKSCIYLKKWLKHAWEASNLDEEILVYDYLGIYFYYQGDITTAKYFHNRSIKGQPEPPNSMLRQIGINQLKLKRQQKLQVYNSRLSERQYQMSAALKTGQIAESIFTDSEDEYNLEIYQTISKTKEKELNVEELPEKLPHNLLEKKFNVDNSPATSYGLCYLNPQYFISHVPTNISPSKSTLLLDSSQKYFKQNERIITQFRNKDILSNFNVSNQNFISKKFKEDINFQRISHLSYNRDLSNFSKNAAEHFSALDFKKSINVKFSQLDRNKIFQHLKALSAEIDKYLLYIATNLNENSNQSSFALYKL